MTKQTWIEDPAAIGLRFVGLATDHMRGRCDYTGWYTNGFQDELARGVVYQLPARHGLERYIYGVADPYNSDSDGSGPFVTALDVIEQDATDKRTWYNDDNPALWEAARFADGEAESYAEREREYDSAWQAGSRFAALGDELTEIRSHIRQIITAWKRFRAVDPETAYATRDSVVASVENWLTERCKAIDERARLADGDFFDEICAGWRTSDNDLLAAFQDGAGSH